MKKLFCCTAFFFTLVVNAQKWITPFEQSSGKESATYDQCIDYYKNLSAAFGIVRIKTFDTTDAGYPLHLVLVSNDKNFDPATWRRLNKIIILINNGIHPGEPDGIDASMMLVRDIATGKTKIPSNVVLGIIPVYNIGGSLNRDPYSRVNQNGPLNYGFRGNAQNLDLNRDFIKADSKNARSFYGIFQYLNPDIFIDNHVSDGADYQHTMTVLTTQHNKLGGAIGSFMNDVFEPAIYRNMKTKNWDLVPYVNFEEGNPEKGWVEYYDPPRYSSGYATLFSTIAFVPETHMLKPYAQRVKSTYDFMVSTAEEAGKHALIIKQKRIQSADSIRRSRTMAVSWVADTINYILKPFKGYAAEYKTSEVTGMNRLYYNHDKPFEQLVKYYDRYTASKTVEKPEAYLIPQGWHEVIDLLKLNKVAMQRLQHDTLMTLEYYRIEDYKSMARPYEKHHRNTDVQLSVHEGQIKLLKGDYIIYTGQYADRYIVETLEPIADDSFFAWNFFDAILQQKEGYSAYRWEDVAAEYLKQHPALRQEMEARKRSDTKFANSAAAQLDFVYKHSPYYEPAHMRYPVYRLKF
ncbi:MAG: hypothetical protein JWN76_1139 [Chitinophagaceae bacterium]|nr:hypothetical protein [Chitinophagaceae bacterium]